MTLKLVLLSVDGTIGASGSVDLAIAKDLAELAKKLVAANVSVGLWSSRAWTMTETNKPLAEFFSDLAGVKISLHGYASDGSPPRRQGNSANPILAKYGAQKWEAVLVGGMKEDMIAGVNNGLLLIRPDWYGQKMDYGFPVKTVSELARFFFVFTLRAHPIFWRITTGNLDVRAAGPFSTMISALKEYGDDAKLAAKFGQGRKDFWFYLVVASIYFSGLVHNIDCICTYPGHKPGEVGAVKAQVNEVLCRLGKCFNKPFYDDLIVRHAEAPKSQYTKAANRKLGTQISTIHLNAKPRKNLDAARPLNIAGKKILVVDDFLTSGKSLEAARAYIESADAFSKSFAWLKTINSDFGEVRPMVKVSPYEKNALIKEPGYVMHTYQDAIVDPHAPVEIAKIFRDYLSWKI